jgi:hypothetical protein
VQLLQSIFIGWIILLSRVKADYSRAGAAGKLVRKDRDQYIKIISDSIPTPARKGHDSMKPVTIVGIVLIVLGIIGFATGGLSFTHRKKVADLGSVQISRETQDTLPLSPIFSSVSLIVGLGLVVVGARSR